MKRIVSGNEVCHLWAHQSQSEASNQTRTVFFEGDTVYSYGSHFPMARIVNNVVLITTRSYSVTTSKHLSWVRSAVTHKACIYVDNVNANSKAEHLKNLAFMRENCGQLLLKASRARTNAPYLLREAESLRNSANEYSAMFKLRLRIKPENIESIKLKAQKQEKAEKAARIKRDKERAEMYRTSLEKWRSGESNHLHYQYDMPVALRLIEDGATVQTTRGARFPAIDAIPAFPLIHKCKESGTSWHRNGANVRLGPYQLDSISKHGDVVAGCHRVSYTEVLHLESLLSC